MHFVKLIPENVIVSFVVTVVVKGILFSCVFYLVLLCFAELLTFIYGACTHDCLLVFSSLLLTFFYF